MSKLNANKFLKAYLEQYEVECKLGARIENNMPTWERNELMKEYKKLSKRMNTLIAKIDEDTFNEFLSDTLCSDYEEYTEFPLGLNY